MPDSRPALTIVVPLYHSAAVLDRLVGELAALVAPGGHELVLVDDGSADDTANVAERLAAAASVPVTVVKLARNFGEHNAVMAGLAHARGAHVVTMDDDLQNPPAEALSLWAHARATGADVVYGDFERKEHRLWRNAGSWLVNRLAGVLLGKPRGLYLSSFRCLSAFAVGELRRYDGPFVYLDGLLLQITRRIERVRVRHAARASGRSGYTLGKLVRLGLSMAVNFSSLPLHVATLLGLAMAGVGFLYAIEVVIEYFVRAQPLGWSSLMAALLVFSGTQLLVLGMAGEYLGRIHLTVNRRPQYVVREVVRPGRSAPASGRAGDAPAGDGPGA